VQLDGQALGVGEGSGTPLVLVTRTGGSRGATSVTVRTRGGSARPGTDFSVTRTRVRFEDGDRSPRLVEIPIREDLTADPTESFTVSLSDPRCAKLGARRSAAVTIADDDEAEGPPPPPPAFTIGGTVDGLRGSGLVLSNLGAELAVSGNGSFAFPGTASDRQTYEVGVRPSPRARCARSSAAPGT
jgi:Calx-beta domain-containing protein